MADPKNESAEDFASTREHEYQDAHYHDEEPEIAIDDVGDGVKKTHANKPTATRRVPPPRKRYFED